MKHVEVQGDSVAIFKKYAWGWNNELFRSSNKLNVKLVFKYF